MYSDLCDSLSKDVDTTSFFVTVNKCSAVAEMGDRLATMGMD